MKNTTKLFAFGILIIFAIIGLVFTGLSLYEYSRWQKGAAPVSLSYNLKNSTFKMIENNVSAENTVEEMPQVSFQKKMTVILMKMGAYLLPFSLGGVLAYILIHRKKK